MHHIYHVYKKGRSIAEIKVKTYWIGQYVQVTTTSHGITHAVYSLHKDLAKSLHNVIIDGVHLYRGYYYDTFTLHACAIYSELIDTWGRGSKDGQLYEIARAVEHGIYYDMWENGVPNVCFYYPGLERLEQMGYEIYKIEK